MRAPAALAVLLTAACAAAPPPAPPASPPPAAVDDHPAVIAVPREPVAAAPLAPPPGIAAAPAPSSRSAPVPSARLGDARAADLVGAWRVIALAGDGDPADRSPAAPVFVVLTADFAAAEIVLEAGEAPRAAGVIVARMPPAEARDRWALEGSTLRIARGGGFPPEIWTVARVEAPGQLGSVVVERGDLVRTLTLRGGAPGPRQLLRRLPGVPGA